MFYYIVYASHDEFETALFTDFCDANDYAHARINSCVGDIFITREETYSTDDSRFIEMNNGEFWMIIEPVMLDHVPNDELM